MSKFLRESFSGFDQNIKDIILHIDIILLIIYKPFNKAYIAGIINNIEEAINK